MIVPEIQVGRVRKLYGFTTGLKKNAKIYIPKQVKAITNSISSNQSTAFTLSFSMNLVIK